MTLTENESGKMRFERLFSLHVLQSYFSDRKGRPFRFELMGECEKRLPRDGMMFRGNDFDCLIIKDLDRLPSSGDSGNYYFAIGLYPSDDHIVLYSELDVDYRKRKVYYLENRKTREGETEHPGVTLHDSRSDDGFTAVSVELKPLEFKFSVEGVSIGDTVSLLDKRDTVVGQWEVSEPGKTAGFYVDVRRKGAGVLRVQVNGRIVAVYFADDHFYKEAPAVIVGLNVSMDDLTKEGQLIPLKFQIEIANRSIYWRYLIFANGVGRSNSSSNGRKLKNLVIDCSNARALADVTFEPEQGETETDCLIFQSDKAIPMVNDGYTDIQLNETDGTGRPLIPHMPNPVMTQVKRRGEKWVGEMFVYI